MSLFTYYQRVFLGFLVLSISFSNLQAQPVQHLVAVNDCGMKDAQPFLVKGDNYKLPAGFSGSKEALTCNYGGTVIYAFDRMDIQADYQLEVVYLADEEREQRIVVDGNELQPSVKLHKGKEQRYRFDLPKKAFAYSQLVMVFEVLKGANAIVSELKLYSSNSQCPVPFEGERKKALYNTQAYKVNTDVDAESKLPTYTAKPYSVPGVYKAELSLNGIWEFTEKPEVTLGKQKSLTENWNSIVVPGQWSMQGFKVDSASIGGYRTSFTLPTDWKNKVVKLRFDGVSSECIVYLNGNEIGKHEGGMTAFEWDVTKVLCKGKNELVLAVRSESTADMLGSLTQYAAHQLGGITRKVSLFAVPEVYVSDLRVVTDLDDTYQNSDLKVYVSVTNSTAKKVQNHTVRVSVEGLPAVFYSKVADLAPGGTWSGWITGKVTRPLLWDNEHPHLYTLKAELSSSEVATEIIQKRIGFREIKITGNQMLVNGKAIKLRGVCRHEAHPLSGRVVDATLARKDVELYRAGNCNFIRTSHYPPTEEFISICDELGMFVEVEAPVCWIGHHANENWRTLNYRDSKYYDYVLQANMETIHFYRNHPSVIMWSMANESYWNKEFAQVQEYVKKADPTRPFTFHDQAYGGFNNQGSTAPVANIHYPGPGGYKVAEKSERPMIYGEYCHLNVYNRSELVTDPGVRSDWALALAPTWENMYKTKGVLGGSIWSGIDDIFQLPNGNAVGYGAWGPIDGWRRPKPEYWDMKKIYSPIRVLTQYLSPAHTLTLEVENRYTYTNLDELSIRWSYGKEHGIVFSDIKAGNKGCIQLSIADPAAANELYLSFTDSRGFIADEYCIPVGKQVQNELPVSATESTKLKKNESKFMVIGKSFFCEISRVNGQILSMKKNGKEILNGGPWLMALPLDGGGCYPNHNANTPLFNDLCSDWKAKSVTAEKSGMNVVIKVEGSYKQFEGHYNLILNANGEFSVQYSFQSLIDVNPRQWGLVFDAPKSYNKVFWRRDGMWSVYPKDHISRPVGEADLYYSGIPSAINPRIEPSWSWSMDHNEIGSNDFRSTRRNIWFAGLKDKENSQVTVRSNGKQHWRCWLSKDKVRFLVADFVTAGNEMFLGFYYAPYRKVIKKGDMITGETKIVLKN